jgi:hypothetical protein
MPTAGLEEDEQSVEDQLDMAGDPENIGEQERIGPAGSQRLPE